MRESTITRYITADGREFEDEDMAVQHERAMVEATADEFLSTCERGVKWKRAMRPMLVTFGLWVLGHEDTGQGDER